jgi:hypothetical protein
MKKNNTMKKFSPFKRFSRTLYAGRSSPTHEDVYNVKMSCNFNTENNQGTFLKKYPEQ